MRNFIKKLKHKNNNENGMSLIEVLISLMLIGIIATTFLNMFMYAFDLSLKAQRITNYTYTTQAVVENTRAMDYRTLQQNSTVRQPHDSNGDGVDDCYIQTSFIPYGVEMKSTGSASTTPSDAVYFHVIYYGVDMMVVAPDGQSLLYTDMSTVYDYELEIDHYSTDCTFSINDDPNYTLNFNRATISSKVVVVINLVMKESSITNSFSIQEQGDAIIKLLGDPAIAGTATQPGTLLFSDANPDERYLGVMNLSTSLVKIKVDLYETNDTVNDTIPQISMSEILEIDNGT